MKLLREILFPLIAVVAAFIVGGSLSYMATTRLRPTGCFWVVRFHAGWNAYTLFHATSDIYGWQFRRFPRGLIYYRS